MLAICVPFMRTAKAMASLHIFASSPEPSTHDNAIRTKLSCVGPNGDLIATHAGSKCAGESHLHGLNLGLDATKPVFGVSEKVRLKSVSSATETS